MTTLQLTARGPYSFQESSIFLRGWEPAGLTGINEFRPLRFAFAVEGDWRTVAVTLRRDGAGVAADVIGGVPAALVASELSRILSLDVDGTGFSAVGERDPVVATLQEKFPGLRPVCFFSAYEAAAWAIICHRIRITQAAAIKRRMTEQLGDALIVGNELVSGFPSPSRLLEVDGFPALAGRKPEYLRGIARAALDGMLDSARLRALPREQALAELQTLPGIGPFSAQLILLRGAGDPDALASEERRLRRAVGAAYGIGEEATAAEVARISEGWRPYRTWVAVLLRTWLEDATGEISIGRRRRWTPRLELRAGPGEGAAVGS